MRIDIACPLIFHLFSCDVPRVHIRTTRVRATATANSDKENTAHARKAFSQTAFEFSAAVILGEGDISASIRMVRIVYATSKGGLSLVKKIARPAPNSFVEPL
jgi:hypothetical protein